MKKLSYLSLLLAFAGLTIFSACKDDDDAKPAAPTATAPSSIPSVTVGGSVDITFTVNTPGGYKSASVTQSAGSATISSQPTAGDQTGSVVVSYTAGTTAGAASVTITVTDNSDQTVAQNATVNVSASPVPTISDIPETATVAAGGLLGPVTANLAAEDGLASLSVTKNGQAFGTDVTYSGETSATYDFQYQTSVEEANSTITFVFTVTDSNGDTNTATHVLTVGDLPTKDVFSSAEGTGTVTWSSDTVYVLRGFVFVNDGQVLTIEPGTVIKGQPGQGSGASALIVARGGKIMAEGTAESPIIFTGLADDLNGSVPNEENALWGGVILLGKATNNNNSIANEKSIEGLPTTDDRSLYGGSADDDNSGIMRYVSIRHGGSVIGSDNEINGLTLGSVGSGTTLENIEIFANLDDGIEFFGGTANLKNAVVSLCGDDGIDLDEGYRGKIQKVLVWHTTQTVSSSDPRGGEWDGGVGADEEAMPFGSPSMANITLVLEDDNEQEVTQKEAFLFRDNIAGGLYNSIIVGHQGAAAVEFRADKESSFDRYLADELNISNNIFYNVNGVTDGANFANLFNVKEENGTATPADVTAFETDMTTNNTFVNPGFGTGVSRFTPTASEVTSDLMTGLPTGLDDLSYKGAIDPGATDPFFKDWTLTYDAIQ
ncbi:hypothetical protein QQ008_09805 [Fulvivirgaceae bacterium BMA10]|uniref:Uncharacterized protein n=1 Tax=Splendidivirga corallicola TaxID=3051826 RepID=A0ABT8KMI3_9BACT|nr:hypothetical protein [Fulvivirgaceae bacterium BMA10]